MARRLTGATNRLLGDDSGSALLEAGLVLPALLVIAFGVVMTGRVVHAHIGVQAVAREAGRTLAAAPSAPEGLDYARLRVLAVAEGHGLASDRLGVTLDAGTFERGGTVQARASYEVALGDLPLLGLLEVTVSSSHQERVELYRSRTVLSP